MVMSVVQIRIMGMCVLHLFMLVSVDMHRGHRSPWVLMDMMEIVVPMDMDMRSFIM